MYNSSLFMDKGLFSYDPFLFCYRRHALIFADGLYLHLSYTWCYFEISVKKHKNWCWMIMKLFNILMHNFHKKNNFKMNFMNLLLYSVIFYSKHCHCIIYKFLQNYIKSFNNLKSLRFIHIFLEADCVLDQAFKTH